MFLDILPFGWQLDLLLCQKFQVWIQFKKHRVWNPR